LCHQPQHLLLFLLCGVSSFATFCSLLRAAAALPALDVTRPMAIATITQNSFSQLLFYQRNAPATFPLSVITPALPLKNNRHRPHSSRSTMDDCDRSVAGSAAEEHHDDSASNKRSIKGQQAVVAACDYCRVRKVKI